MKLLACILLLLCGCATLDPPSRVRLELEHVSHPLAGWPFSDRYDEDGLTQAQALLEWEGQGVYFDIGVGHNLRGRNGGGFYGPSLTGTARVGYVIELQD